MSQVYTFGDGETVEIKNKNRFTRFSPKGHPDMWIQEKWCYWFRSRGINACLVEVKGKGFAVYRNGLIDLSVLAERRQGAKAKPLTAPRKRGRPRKEPVVTK